MIGSAEFGAGPDMGDGADREPRLEEEAAPDRVPGREDVAAADRAPRRGGDMDMPVPRRPGRYYAISEVADRLEVKAHVLRYWETQFPLLRPRKHRSGSRRYTEKDIDLLRTIREMLHERGYTIAGARARLLEEQRQRQAEASPQSQLDFLGPSDRRQLRSIRDDLASLRERLLGGPGATEITIERRGESR